MISSIQIDIEYKDNKNVSHLLCLAAELLKTFLQLNISRYVQSIVARMGTLRVEQVC